MTWQTNHSVSIQFNFLIFCVGTSGNRSSYSPTRVSYALTLAPHRSTKYDLRVLEQLHFPTPYWFEVNPLAPWESFGDTSTKRGDETFLSTGFNVNVFIIQSSLLCLHPESISKKKFECNRRLSYINSHLTMEWIEPVDVKSAVKFSSSLVNSTEEESPNVIHGSITGKKESPFMINHLW